MKPKPKTRRVFELKTRRAWAYIDESCSHSASNLSRPMLVELRRGAVRCGCRCGPIVPIDVPLPKRKKGKP